MDWWPPIRMPSDASVRADLLGHPAIRRGREPVAPVRLGDRHAEGSELCQAADHLGGNAALALDRSRVHAVAGERPEGFEKGRDRLALRRVDLGVREHRVFRDRTVEEGLDDGDEARVGRRGGFGTFAHGMISPVEGGASG